MAWSFCNLKATFEDMKIIKKINSKMYNFTSDRTKNVSSGVKEILSPFSKTPKNMMSIGIEVYAKTPP
ncbi:hypothetical protein BC30048_1981 [Bacillus cereus]|nr:hypothetical protein BC30048_1981 [Bacillus cereus]CJB61321.1 Uncharacterised protein [Streptococcus pneumoniae]